MMTDMVGGVEQSDDVDLKQFQGKYGESGTIRQEDEISAFRLDPQTGLMNIYGVRGTENVMIGESGENGLGYPLLGSLNYLDGFDMEDLTSQ
jgi:hypothetical protein